MKGVYRELIAALSYPPFVPLCFEPTFSPPSLSDSFAPAPRPPSRFVPVCWGGTAGKGVSGSVANAVKALRIPESAAAANQPRPTVISCHQSHKSFPFASLPPAFPRRDQRLRVFKLHVAASLRSLKASIDSKGWCEFLITQMCACFAQHLSTPPPILQLPTSTIQTSASTRRRLTLLRPAGGRRRARRKATLAFDRLAEVWLRLFDVK